MGHDFLSWGTIDDFLLIPVVVSVWIAMNDLAMKYHLITLSAKYISDFSLISRDSKTFIS